jgi:hypothetical protein
MQHDALEDGLYESLVTASLDRELAALPGHVTKLEKVDAADEPDVLARYVAKEMARVLRDTKNEAQRVDLVNDPWLVRPQFRPVAPGLPRRWRLSKVCGEEATRYRREGS